jgi:hypothetical protein
MRFSRGGCTRHVLKQNGILVTRPHPAYYPIAKMILSLIPFVIGLVFLQFSRFGKNTHRPPVELLKKACAVLIVAAAGAGSIRYYCGVLNNDGPLKYLKNRVSRRAAASWKTQR